MSVNLSFFSGEGHSDVHLAIRHHFTRYIIFQRFLSCHLELFVPEVTPSSSVLIQKGHKSLCNCASRLKTARSMEQFVARIVS